MKKGKIFGYGFVMVQMENAKPGLLPILYFKNKEERYYMQKVL